MRQGTRFGPGNRFPRLTCQIETKDSYGVARPVSDRRGPDAAACGQGDAAKDQSVDAGTNDFLSKPVNKVELLKRVQNMIQLKDIQDENERLRRYIEQMEETSGPTGSS